MTKTVDMSPKGATINDKVPVNFDADCVISIRLATICGILLQKATDTPEKAAANPKLCKALEELRGAMADSFEFDALEALAKEKKIKAITRKRTKKTDKK